MNSDPDLKSQTEEVITDGPGKARKATIVTALIIIGIGVVLLLNQLGMFPPRFLFNFWPSILIVVGLAQMLIRQGRDRVAGAGLVLAGVLVQPCKLGQVRVEELWSLMIVFAVAVLLRYGLGGK